MAKSAKPAPKPAAARRAAMPVVPMQPPADIQITSVSPGLFGGSSGTSIVFSLQFSVGGSVTPVNVQVQGYVFSNGQRFPAVAPVMADAAGAWTLQFDLRNAQLGSGPASLKVLYLDAQDPASEVVPLTFLIFFVEKHLARVPSDDGDAY